MPDLIDPSYLLTRQYKDASKLNARVQLHARFSTNPYGWFRWVFEQYDFPQACRVLKLGGRLFATTAGEKHMRESRELGYRFDSGRAVDRVSMVNGFTLENGLAQLQPFFPSIQHRRYPDSLHVTESAPLVDYILSTFSFRDRADARPALLAFVEREMQQNGGAIDITKKSGMFIAQ